MNPQTKTCQNCKRDFTIESGDFDFYEKIKVPAPTFCPECRMVRRMCFRNERALYRRKCDFCKNNILSIYAEDKSFVIYCPQCWWSDNWDIMDYNSEYKFDIPFFQQWRTLLEKAPRLALSVMNMVNCDFCNVAQNEKDCYVISASDGNERVMFSNRVVQDKDSVDLYVADKSELCYELVNCLQCYRLFFSQNCVQCQDSAFLFGCSNCSHCFSCANLRNKKYCIFNKQYTKEEYQEKLKEFNIGSFFGLSDAKEQYQNFLLKNIFRFATIIKSINSTGDNIRQAKNCHFCFDVVGNPSAEDCKFAVWAGYDAKDSYDIGVGGGLKVERSYEITDTGLGSNRVFATVVVYHSFDVSYSNYCYNCSHLFGCIGLRNKQYCILNKQYTKEEYEKLVPRIIEHMDTMPYISRTQNSNVKTQNHNSNVKTEENVKAKEIVYRYGEFFPPELSPFCYNETIAQEYFPLTKEQAQEQGYSWKDPEPRNYQIDIKTEDLPDNIKDVKDDIIGKVIECANSGSCRATSFGCTEAFKIIEPELQFYKRLNLPLPRLCPNCRHYARLKQRNPLKLWKRQCQCQGKTSGNGVYQNTVQHQHENNPCPNEFETSYAPDRPEIVYCEQCYLQEVV